MLEPHAPRRRGIGIAGLDFGGFGGLMVSDEAARIRRRARRWWSQTEVRGRAEQGIGVGGQGLKRGFEAQAGGDAPRECDGQVAQALMESRFGPEAPELCLGEVGPGSVSGPAPFGSAIGWRILKC